MGFAGLAQKPLWSYWNWSELPAPTVSFFEEGSLDFGVEL